MVNKTLQVTTVFGEGVNPFPLTFYCTSSLNSGKNYEMERVLVDFFNKNRGNEFLEWKLVRAFQSFNSMEIKTMLEEMVKEHKNKVIVTEAKRSLSRMENRIPLAGGVTALPWWEM